MIEVSVELDGFEAALDQFHAQLPARLHDGLDATCEAIAARARETTTYTDRTGLLRQSTQNAGVEESGGVIAGIVSFAARSKTGYPYGLALEFGTHQGARAVSNRQAKREGGLRFKGPRQRKGIKARRFIRDAIEAQDGSLLESSMGAAFRDAGFVVRGG